MSVQLIFIMSFQLAGELLVSCFGLQFPGALCGLLLLLGWISWRGSVSTQLSQAADTLVEYLGLLFVPAGAAVIGFGTLLMADGVAIAGALLLSTALAILVTGLLGIAPTTERDGSP